MRANTDQPAPDDGRFVNARPLPIFAILTLKSRADPSEETPGELRPQYNRWAQQSNALPVSANRLMAAVDPSSSQTSSSMRSLCRASCTRHSNASWDNTCPIPNQLYMDRGHVSKPLLPCRKGATHGSWLIRKHHHAPQGWKTPARMFSCAPTTKLSQNIFCSRPIKRTHYDNLQQLFMRGKIVIGASGSPFYHRLNRCSEDLAVDP